MKLAYGALCEIESQLNVLCEIESRLNKKGYTLGSKVDLVQSFSFAISLCYVNGLLTDAETNKAYRRLDKWIGKNIVPIKKDGEDNVNDVEPDRQ